MGNHSLWPPKVLKKGKKYSFRESPSSGFFPPCVEPMTIRDGRTLTDEMETSLLVSKLMKYLEVSVSCSEGILKNYKTGFI